MLGLNTSEFSFTKNSHENKAFLSSGNLTLAQSIQPKFLKILDRFGPTGKVSKKTGPPFEGSQYMTIGLAGCRIWLFFVVILGMRDESRSGMREF